MKNPSFSTFLLTAALLVAACDGGNNSSQGNRAFAGTDTKEAGEIIKFNNAFIKLDDRNNAYLEKVRSNIEKIVSKIESPSTLNYIDKPFEEPIYMAEKDLAKVPASLNDADREFFRTNIALMNSLYGEIKTGYNTLYDYMQAEDYKDDNYAKGKSLVVLLNSLGTKYYTAESAVVQKLDTVSDMAERTLLKDNPLKDFIYAFKDDNNAVANLNGLLDSAANNYKVFQTAAEAAYAKLDAQYKKHSAAAWPDRPEYANQKDAFRRYYTTLNEYLLFVRKKMRDAAATGRIDDEDAQYLRRQQDALRVYYNDFVG